jgi:hypothetical protein
MVALGFELRLPSYSIRHMHGAVSGSRHDYTKLPFASLAWNLCFVYSFVFL